MARTAGPRQGRSSPGDGPRRQPAGGGGKVSSSARAALRRAGRWRAFLPSFFPWPRPRAGSRNKQSSVIRLFFFFF